MTSHHPQPKGPVSELGPSGPTNDPTMDIHSADTPPDPSETWLGQPEYSASQADFHTVMKAEETAAVDLQRCGQRSCDWGYGIT